MLKSILFGVFMGATLFFAPFVMLFFLVFFLLMGIGFRRRMRYAKAQYRTVRNDVYAMSGFESVVFKNRNQNSQIIHID
jgi:hypothetical protein